LTSGNKTLFELLITAKDPETGRELSDEVIRDNVITFLFAGHDTTAHSMAFTVYELTQNPIVLKKLQEELDRVLGDNDMPDANQLKEFEYLDMIIKVRDIDIF
jgi:cytochrome P450/NADPH-cytochrome P450 reductase